MNQGTPFRARSLSASEYILALHDPSDLIAVLVRNCGRGRILQRIATAETIAGAEFQQWLAGQNRSGSDVFVGMNPLKHGASSRTKESIKEIRHVYLDLDEDAEAALAGIRNSLDVPPANFVLDTSPGKHQVVWKIENIDMDQAELLLHALANQFGGDTAATDITRVLRLPDFANRKYRSEPEFVVRAHHESNQLHSLRDFTIRDDSPDLGRYSEDPHSSGRKVRPGHKSQSEADWAYAKRALARGDDPQEVIRRIADYRANDKHDPQYYAFHTVRKAQKQLQTRDDAEPYRPGVTQQRRV